MSAGRPSNAPDPRAAPGGATAPGAQTAAPTAGSAPPRPPVRRPSSLLPPSATFDRPLLVVVALIVALACAAAIAARAAWSAADAWTAGLAGAMTVEVRPSGDLRPEDAAAEAARALAAVPGVTGAQALSREEVEALLAPWLGDAGVPADTPLPGLVDIRLDRLAPAAPADLLAALEAAGLSGEVDDHESWAAQIRRAAGAARTLALLACTALLAAAAAVIAFATRASMAARGDVVEVLRMVGAHDDFIAGIFTRRFLALGLKAGLAGAALAALAGLAAMLLTQGGPADFAPRFRFALADAIILVLAPAASAAAAALTARETVRRALARLY